MNNSEKFQEVFGCYATEMWATSEAEFLNWINAEYVENVVCKIELEESVKTKLIENFETKKVILKDIKELNKKYITKNEKK